MPPAFRRWSLSTELATFRPAARISASALLRVTGPGIFPGERINAGHALTLPSNVDGCNHAMGMDESRALFPLTRLCEPRQIGDHRFGLERRRRYSDTDCLHTTVVLSEGIPARPHNNAMPALRRMNDDGEFVTV